RGDDHRQSRRRRHRRGGRRRNPRPGGGGAFRGALADGRRRAPRRGECVLALRWAAALVHRRPGRISGPVAGVAVAVALLGSLGAFLTTAKREMTSRAVRQVPVDWQVEVQPGGSTAEVL